MYLRRGVKNTISCYYALKMVLFLVVNKQTIFIRTNDLFPQGTLQERLSELSSNRLRRLEKNVVKRPGVYRESGVLPFNKNTSS
jgi:hypothetical protein